MSSPFQGISMASQALQAFQQQLDVTGNNIANVNTPGYSREVGTMGQNTPSLFYSGGHGQSVGNGVSLVSVNRMRDMFLQAQSLSSASSLGKTNAQLSGGQQVQSLFTDVSGTGISTDLSSFYNSWSALASQPNDANRQQVQQAGQALTNDVRSTYASLQQQSTQVTQQVSQTITQIQGFATQIATLNNQIKQMAATGASPNTLMDQRDQAIQNLSGLVDVNVQTYNDGTVAVNVNQFNLVDEGGAHPFPTTGFNAANGTVTDGTTNFSVNSGQLSGLFSQLNTISSTQGQLDTFANTLRTQVNTLHNAGTTELGTTGQNFFNDANPQTGAVDFNLDPNVAANYKYIATGTSGNAGDTTLATQISQARDTAMAGLGNATTTQYYTGMVSNIGQQVSNYTSNQSTQQAVSTQISNQIQSVSGVNIDEEMSNMLQFQRSYQAAAKALTIADTVLQDLINVIQ